MSRGASAHRVRWWLLATLALVCLALQFDGRLLPSLGALALWLGAVGLVDVRALRRLWLPKFWLFSLGVSLASGLLLGKTDLEISGMPLSLAGCKAGLLMVVRGALLLSLTSWSNRLIGGARMQRALARMKFAGFGKALSAAFALLPDLTAQLRHHARTWRDSPGPAGSRLGRLRETAVQIIVETARLAEDAACGKRLWAGTAAADVHRIPLVAVVGAPQSGKTTLVLQIVDELKERGISVAGVVQLGVHDGEGRSGYNLKDVNTGVERSFASRRKTQRAHELGYDFDASGWIWARNLIQHPAKKPQVLVVDELGRLEAVGKGHMPAVEAALAAGVANLALIAARADCFVDITNRLSKPVLVIPTEGGDSVRSIADQIAALAKAEPASPGEVSP